MHISYEITAHNHGSGPALFAQINPQIWTGTLESSSANPIEKRICPDHAFMYAGGTIFPNDDLKQSFDIPVSLGAVKTLGFPRAASGVFVAWTYSHVCREY
jgi:hypothetical protein